MRLTILFFSMSCLVLIACHHKNANFGTTKFKSYSESPGFIKACLDSLSDGKFLIAEKGESWNGGCVVKKNKASRQFITASLNKGSYHLEFWRGGIAVSKQFIDVSFNEEKVLSYSEGNRFSGYKVIELNQN